jgi:hypothetical protein
MHQGICKSKPVSRPFDSPQPTSKSKVMMITWDYIRCLPSFRTSLSYHWSELSKTSNNHNPKYRMSAPIARAATQAGKATAKSAEGHVLNKGAKRDPELYVWRASSLRPSLDWPLCRFSWLSCPELSDLLDSISVIQYHPKPCTGRSIDNFPGRKPTSATSESKVSMVQGSMPWQTNSTKGDEAREHFKYQYRRTARFSGNKYWHSG